MNPSATKSHLSVDTKNKHFLFYQKVMHSLAVTVTEVTKGCRVLLSLLSLSLQQIAGPYHQLERINHANRGS